MDQISWAVLVDTIAAPLRLESPARCAYGRLATLHLIAEIWGEIALLRAAERFVRLHHVTVAELLDYEPQGSEHVWFASFLERLGKVEEIASLPAALLRPAAQGFAL